MSKYYYGTYISDPQVKTRDKETWTTRNTEMTDLYSNSSNNLWKQSNLRCQKSRTDDYIHYNYWVAINCKGQIHLGKISIDKLFDSGGETLTSIERTSFCLLLSSGGTSTVLYSTMYYKKTQNELIIMFATNNYNPDKIWKVYIIGISNNQETNNLHLKFMPKL